MSETKYDARLARLLDRTEIFDLVRTERFYRDQRDWKGPFKTEYATAAQRRSLARAGCCRPGC